VSGRQRRPGARWTCARPSFDMTDPAGLRRAYIRGQLSENSLAATWYRQLRAWFDAAAANPAIVEPNAIQLATVSGRRRAVRPDRPGQGIGRARHRFLHQLRLGQGG